MVMWSNPGSVVFLFLLFSSAMLLFCTAKIITARNLCIFQSYLTISSFKDPILSGIFRIFKSKWLSSCLKVQHFLKFLFYLKYISLCRYALVPLLLYRLSLNELCWLGVSDDRMTCEGSGRGQFLRTLPTIMETNTESLFKMENLRHEILTRNFQVQIRRIRATYFCSIRSEFRLMCLC
jgi:hypothetical protein